MMKLAFRFKLKKRIPHPNQDFRLYVKVMVGGKYLSDRKFGGFFKRMQISFGIARREPGGQSTFIDQIAGI